MRSRRPNLSVAIKEASFSRIFNFLSREYVTCRALDRKVA